MRNKILGWCVLRQTINGRQSAGLPLPGGGRSTNNEACQSTANRISDDDSNDDDDDEEKEEDDTRNVLVFDPLGGSTAKKNRCTAAREYESTDIELRSRAPD